MRAGRGAAFLVAASLVLLQGCALLSGGSPPSPPLLTPASLKAERTASQTLSLAFGAQAFDLQCALSANAKQVRLIALGPLGRRVLTLDYDGERVQSQAEQLPSDLPPERVLADLQLALWPLAAWTEKLRASGWEVSEPRPRLRRLRRDGRLIEEVHYAGDDPWNGSLWLVNLALGYSLEVETHAQ